MKNVFVSFPEFMRLGALALGLSIQMHVFAGTEQSKPASSLPALPADIAELKFRDFFVMPMGPRGQEMTPTLLALDGRRVRILGYMAGEENRRPGVFVLTPVPVDVAEVADDLPPTLLVHFPPAQANRAVPYQAGLLVLTGTLSVSHPSEVRLLLDAPPDPLAQLSL